MRYKDTERRDITEDEVLQEHPVPADVSRLLEPLLKRLQIVVILRQGFDSLRPRSLEEVGHQMGLTRERIRQLQNKALNILAQLHPKGEDLILTLPFIGCECGKYVGPRYKGITCDKCGEEVLLRGAKIFNFWEDICLNVWAFKKETNETELKKCREEKQGLINLKRAELRENTVELRRLRKEKVKEVNERYMVLIKEVNKRIRLIKRGSLISV